MQMYTKMLKDKLWDIESNSELQSIENKENMPSLVVLHKSKQKDIEGIKIRGDTMKFKGIKIVFSENMLENKGFIYDFTGKLIRILNFEKD